MKVKKYTIPITFFIIYLVFILIFLILADPYIPDIGGMTTLIPINNMFIQSAIILLIILPISSILGIFGGYVFAPIILIFHKKILGKKYDYNIQDKPISDKFSILTRGFVPVLMAMNFAFMLSIPQLQQVILSPFWASGSGSLVDAIKDLISLIVLLIFTFGISIFIFSGTWFLLDSGIVYSTKRAVQNKEEPYEILSLGGWINRLLKGYAGLSVLITYFTMTIEYLRIIWDMGAIGLINLIIYLPFPFLLLFPVIPGLILSDIIIERRIKYVRRIAEKLGITQKFED
ncbi:MAG: hypothetical protein EAX96_17210 [Candidatus Lokiarchaeota archaeon]|nr:hypothetical protein [Candidatus Lokiarchaeota archaeon]